MANIPTYELHIKPNHVHGADAPSSNYNVIWIDHESDSTNVMPNGDNRTILTPDSPRSGIKGWEWWFAYEVKIDSSWNSGAQGGFGTIIPNIHNSANDVGNVNGSGAIGWGWGTGTSSVQCDYIGGTFYQHLQYSNFPNKENPISVNMTKGVWHSVLHRLIWGRIDGTVTSSGHPNQGRGRMWTWFDGSDTPIDTGNINTLQRDDNPQNGQFYTQTCADVWDGFYSQNVSSELILSITACRIGRTVQECLADTPVKVGDRVANIYRGTGTNLGPSFYNTITSRTTENFLLPSQFGGSNPPAPPTRIGPWSEAIQWNAGGAVVVEQNIGPWADPVQWNAATDFSGEVPTGTITLTPVDTDTQTLTPLED